MRCKWPLKKPTVSNIAVKRVYLKRNFQKMRNINIYIVPYVNNPYGMGQFNAPHANSDFACPYTDLVF